MAGIVNIVGHGPARYESTTLFPTHLMFLIAVSRNIWCGLRNSKEYLYTLYARLGHSIILTHRTD